MMGVSGRDATLSITPYDLYERQLTLRGSFIRNFDFQRSVRMLDRLQLEPLVGTEYPLERAADAIDAVAEGRGLKTVIVASPSASAVWSRDSSKEDA